jgi:hypothetical protein
MSAPYLYIDAATYQDDYKLVLTFNTGELKTVDFSSFINQSLHPDIKKYQNLELFKQFSLTNGDLQWHDYELCFPIADLYQNQL